VRPMKKSGPRATLLLGSVCILSFGSICYNARTVKSINDIYKDMFSCSSATAAGTDMIAMPAACLEGGGATSSPNFQVADVSPAQTTAEKTQEADASIINISNLTPSSPNRIDRIYFINLDTTPLRQAFMEGWLSKQTIPFERIPGKVGDPSDTCVEGKREPKQCRGIAGVSKSNLSIIDSYNTTGLTLVFQDDWSADNITRLQESISLVPDDWDILRFNCWGHIPSDFVPFLHVEPENELGISKIFETRHDREQPPCNAKKETCWFSGGTHAMVWRGGESVQKLRKLWSVIPYNDDDNRLTVGDEVDERYNIKSYCINFREYSGVIQTKIKGEISSIPHPDGGNLNLLHSTWTPRHNAPGRKEKGEKEKEKGSGKKRKRKTKE
jgi:hypothetical protein